MKRCPECRRDYYDDSLAYCLDDGSVLLDGPPSGDESATRLIPDFRSNSGTRISEVRDDPTSTTSMPSSKVNSVAVLPFAHLSRDADDEYFCDGLAEELINAIGKLEDVKVVARTSAFSFKGKNLDISEIARILSVSHIVEGSVRKSGDRMRISVQLINAADRFQVWSEKYDTDLGDLFDIQDEITRSVTAALRPKLRSREAAMADLIAQLQQHAGSIEAYQLYLRGRFHFNKLTPEGFRLALDSFQQALAVDPGFAAAYAGIADAHVFSAELGPVPPLEAMPRAKTAALEALALDPSNAEAHTTLAFIHQEFDFDFESAEREYKKAIELNPNAPMAHQYYGALLSQLGRQEEAEREFHRANVLDPLSPSSNWVRPLGLFFARRYDECIQVTENLLALDADFPAAHLIASFAYHMKGDFGRCVEAYTRFLELCDLVELAAAAREAFESGEWPSFLGKMTSREVKPFITSYIAAVFYVALSENDQALAMLEESFHRREGHLVMLKVDPRLERLHENTRFKELLGKVGFPDR